MLQRPFSLTLGRPQRGWDCICAPGAWGTGAGITAPPAGLISLLSTSLLLSNHAQFCPQDRQGPQLCLVMVSPRTGRTPLGQGDRETQGIWGHSLGLPPYPSVGSVPAGWLQALAESWQGQIQRHSVFVQGRQSNFPITFCCVKIVLQAMLLSRGTSWCSDGQLPMDLGNWLLGEQRWWPGWGPGRHPAAGECRAVAVVGAGRAPRSRPVSWELGGCPAAGQCRAGPSSHSHPRLVLVFFVHFLVRYSPPFCLFK